MSLLTEMPIQIDVVDPETKKLAERWRRWFRKAITTIVLSAPAAAQYLLATHEPDLPAERNLGALATGYLKLTTVAGVATPSTVTTLPTADLTGTFPATSLSGTIPDARFPATLPAISGANLTNLNLAAIAGLVSGIYTPTLTNAVNVAASTAYSCQYLQLGTTVTVSGHVDVDPTAAGDTQLGISLPVASNFANVGECAGVGAAPGIAGQCAGILADVTNDRAVLRWTAVDVTNQAMYFSFTYRVI